MKSSKLEPLKYGDAINRLRNIFEQKRNKTSKESSLRLSSEETCFVLIEFQRNKLGNSSAARL